MGIDFYIGDDQISLSSATWYYEFRNWVAEQGTEHNCDFPHILEHSDINGSYLFDENEPPSLYSGSVFKLKEELEELLGYDPPDYAEYIIKQMLEGCEVSVRKKTKITMDDGAWDGE